MRNKTILALTALLGVAAVYGAASAATAAAIQGHVVDAESGAPIAGARISVPELGLETLTDSQGAFRFSGISLAVDPFPITVGASAPGYGDWEIQQVRLHSADTLILDIQMGTEPVTIVVPPPRSDAPSWPAFAQPDGAQGGAGPLAADQPLPGWIRVRVTGYPYCDTSRPYTVEVVDFREYAKHVLPNEWGASWPYESLRAGAMAVKMYAWSYIAAGGKWPDADVYDSTCDQVYIPAISYASTNRAVDFTWNWRLARNDALLRTFYRAYYSQCEDVGLEGNCMGQWESRDMAYDLYTWDEILFAFYDTASLSPVWNPPGGFSLRFYGNGYGDLDRVKVPIDPQVPVDVGGDLTLEWWMKALAAENSSASCTPGGINWVYGNQLFDRDVYGPGDHGDYGISLAGSRIAFGVAVGSDSETLCGSTVVADGEWHHVAVTRALSGAMQIFVDGVLDASGLGPSGDISYRDGRSTTYPSDPFLVIGAEKHDIDNLTYPSFSGWLDEIRLSDVVRYTTEFTAPADRFTPDANTVALYHLNEGVGNVIGDSSGAAGGPSTGERKYGGAINGPEWTDDTVWYVPPPTPTPTSTPTASATPSPTSSSTATPGPSPTASATSTASSTPSATASLTATASATPSITPTPSATASPTPTASLTPSATHTPTATFTPSATHTPTATLTPSSSPTPTFSPTPSATATLTPSATPTPSPTASPTPTWTPSATPPPTVTPTWTPTTTPSATATPAPSATPSPSATNVPGASPTPAAPGDLNGDGAVNVLDLQLSVNVFLGVETDPTISARADIDGNGIVNVLDIQHIANLVLTS